MDAKPNWKERLKGKYISKYVGGFIWVVGIACGSSFPIAFRKQNYMLSKDEGGGVPHVRKEERYESHLAEWEREWTSKIGQH